MDVQTAQLDLVGELTAPILELLDDAVHTKEGEVADGKMIAQDAGFQQG
jgi:hypothetical protein